MSGALENNQIIQIGFLVKDIEKTKVDWAEFLGVEVPETVNSGKFEVTQTEYLGEKVPNASCNMCFFYLGNLQMELIQPNGEKSCWQDHLDRFGEGIHHISFKAKDLDASVQRLEEKGMPLVQRGVYRGGNGEYAFLDATDSLKTVIEFLHSYEDK